ncbi:hypothetical protein M3E13_16645 [Oceanobacillus kimchii]|uniref:hypothetical protein n=1 Tax=Oceanobacillus kimchii TaxID=746691 RepID=UPI0021A40848|nr:hypothetical protein [Oceanobacillus kimchii]MCT1577963.1 hypothetical protein [Oceanobacillus kimchii]MCT2137523.1 hypothetical protein [Oceanobacillus kimchii]
MKSIPVEVYKNYNNFFDYVSLEALLIIVIGGLATLFGAYLGARVAGQKSVEAVLKQIEYSEKEKQRSEEIRQKKYDIYLEVHLNEILKQSKRVSFFMRLMVTHNEYNVDPEEEVERIISDLNSLMKQLYNIDPSYISLDKYKLLGKIKGYIKDIELYYKAFLATFEDEASNSQSNLIETVNNLELLIKRSSTSQLEDTE